MQCRWLTWCNCQRLMKAPPKSFITQTLDGRPGSFPPEDWTFYQRSERRTRAWLCALGDRYGGEPKAALFRISEAWQFLSHRSFRPNISSSHVCVFFSWPTWISLVFILTVCRTDHLQMNRLSRFTSSPSWSILNKIMVHWFKLHQHFNAAWRNEEGLESFRKNRKTQLRKIFALASVLVGSINTLMKLQSNLQKELKTVEQIGANSSGMLRWCYTPDFSASAKCAEKIRKERLVVWTMWAVMLDWSWESNNEEVDDILDQMLYMLHLQIIDESLRFPRFHGISRQKFQCLSDSWNTVASWQVPKKQWSCWFLTFGRKLRIHRWRKFSSWEFVFGTWCYMVHGILLALMAFLFGRAGENLLWIFKGLTLRHDFQLREDVLNKFFFFWKSLIQQKF